jgi:hypothetical protein
MFATYFEWKIRAGHEDEFLSIWHEGTTLLLGEGSLGSALFKGDDGRFRALARWPDRATRDAASARVFDAPVFARMRGVVEEAVHCNDMIEVDNLWRF